MKSTDTGLSFAAYSMGLSSTQRAPNKYWWCAMVVQSHSRSSKFAPIESPYAISC